MRVEKDSIGTKEIDDEKYYGIRIHTSTDHHSCD